MALGEFWTLYPKLLRIPAGQLYSRSRTPHRQNLSHLHLVTWDSRKVFSGVLAVVEPAFEVSWTSIPPKPPRWTHPCNSIDLQMEIQISTKCTLWQVPGTSIFVQHLVPSPGPSVQPQLVTIKQDKMNMSIHAPPPARMSFNTPPRNSSTSYIFLRDTTSFTTQKIEAFCCSQYNIILNLRTASAAHLPTKP